MTEPMTADIPPGDFANVTRFIQLVVTMPRGREHTTVPCEDLRAVVRELQRLYQADAHHGRPPVSVERLVDAAGSLQMHCKYDLAADLLLLADWLVPAPNDAAFNPTGGGGLK